MTFSRKFKRKNINKNEQCDHMELDYLEPSEKYYESGRCREVKKSEEKEPVAMER